MATASGACGIAMVTMIVAITVMSSVVSGAPGGRRGTGREAGGWPGRGRGKSLRGPSTAQPLNCLGIWSSWRRAGWGDGPDTPGTTEREPEASLSRASSFPSGVYTEPTESCRAWVRLPGGSEGGGGRVAGGQLATQGWASSAGHSHMPGAHRALGQAARVGAHAGGSWGLGTWQAAVSTLEDMR